MMDAAALLARMEAQRASWVELGPGRKVRIVRPPELDLVQLVGGVRVEHAQRYVTGWQGFTEASLLGAAHGSADTEVPFDSEVWGAYIADHLDEARVVVDALADRVRAYLEEREAREKNSEPSSTS